MGALFLCVLASAVAFVFWALYKFTKWVLARSLSGESARYLDRIEAEKLVERSEDAERRRRLTGWS